MEMRVKPRKKWRAEIEVPGDKSISHRAFILGALGKGITKVDHVLLGEDCISTMKCLEAMGAVFERTGDTAFAIHGRGAGSLKEPADVLCAGNSGTTMRLLSGLLAGMTFFSCISGDSSLNRRPMKRVIEPLTHMGAKIWARGENCYAPIAFRGAPLRGIDYTLPVASAQVKSALLLAGLLADGEMTIHEPYATRDHTEHMLKAMGADVTISGNAVSLVKPGALSPVEMRIPGDISSAAFFMAAGAALPDAEIILRGTGINHTRIGFIAVLKSMGADLTMDQVSYEIPGEPCGDIKVSSAGLKSASVSGEIVPRLIDELPLLAVIATQAEGGTVVRDAAELRVKETDRIIAIVSELRKMKAKIEELEDGFIVEGPVALQGCRVKSHGDHRIAMSLAIAGLLASGETIIEDAECVNISFPEFFPLLQAGAIE